MGIIKRLFGRKSAPRGSIGVGNEGSVIEVYDESGQKYLISKSTYRRKLLLQQFRDAGDDPDKLYGAIVIALQDGFEQGCLDAAKKLYQIDRNLERSTAIMGIVLMRNGKLNEAQRVLEDYLNNVGESGVILTNLAKVFAGRGMEEQSFQTLWRALYIDPNQENGLEWWGAIHRERNGDEGFASAMKQAAGIEGSWRPQLWIARDDLGNGDLATALAVYRQVLSMVPDDGDASMMISGDLGNNGYPKELLELLGPVYRAEKHGAMTGLNLVQACIHLRLKDEGLRICGAVEGLQRYDLKAYIAQCRAQLMKL